MGAIQSKMSSHVTNGSLSFTNNAVNSVTRYSTSSGPQDEENESASIHTFYSANEGLQGDNGEYRTPKSQLQEQVASATTGWSLIKPQLVNRSDAPFVRPEYPGPPFEPQCSSRLHGPFPMPEQARFALNTQSYHDNHRGSEVQRFVGDKLAPAEDKPPSTVQPLAVKPPNKDVPRLPLKTDGKRSKGRLKLTKNKRPSNPSSGLVVAHPPFPCSPPPVGRQQKSREYTGEKKRPPPLNLDKSSFDFSKPGSTQIDTSTADKKFLSGHSTQLPKKQPSIPPRTSAVVSRIAIETKQPSVRRPTQGQIGNYADSTDERRPVSPVSCGSLGSPVSPIASPSPNKGSVLRKPSSGDDIFSRDHQCDPAVEVLRPTKGQPTRVDCTTRSRLDDLARGCWPTPDGDSDIEADSTLWWPVPPRHGGFAARFEFGVNVPLNKPQYEVDPGYGRQGAKEKDEESDGTVTIAAARSKGKQCAQSDDDDDNGNEPTIEECLEIKDFELHLTSGKEVRHVEFTEPRYCFRMNDEPAEALYNHGSRAVRRIRYYSVIPNLSLPRDMDRFTMHASFVARCLCPGDECSLTQKKFPVTLEAWLLNGRWAEQVVDRDHFRFRLVN